MLYLCETLEFLINMTLYSMYVWIAPIVLLKCEENFNVGCWFSPQSFCFDIVRICDIFTASDTRATLHMSINSVIQHGFSESKVSPSATRHDEIALLSLFAAIKKVAS